MYDRRVALFAEEIEPFTKVLNRVTIAMSTIVKVARYATVASNHVLLCQPM